MPRQSFIGSNAYNDMACHVFALSGDPAQEGAVNQRYTQLGDLLFGIVQAPVNNNVAAGLTVVTNTEILASPGPDAAPALVAPHSLGLLCREFGFVPQPDTGIRLWGHFEQGQLLPEHMWVTIPDGMIYDTMPGAPIRRRNNNIGLNPPSYGDDAFGNDILLNPNVVFSIEVAALAAGTQAVVNTPNNQWA